MMNNNIVFILWLLLHCIMSIKAFSMLLIVNQNFIQLKNMKLNTKNLDNDYFEDMKKSYNDKYMATKRELNGAIIEIFICSFLPIINLMIYIYLKRLSDRVLNDIKELESILDCCISTTTQSNIKRYLNDKIQNKEIEIIEKALNNKTNPYFELITNNAKMINDIITEYEKNDYILNKERSINFNKNINDTILRFIQVIELIDNLNFKSDTTTINLTKYDKYLTDLKSNLSEIIDKEVKNNE